MLPCVKSTENLRKISPENPGNTTMEQKSAKLVPERISRLRWLEKRGHIIQCLQFPHRVQERRWRGVQAPFLPYG